MVLAGIKASVGEGATSVGGEQAMDTGDLDRLCAGLHGPRAQNRLLVTLPTVQAREPLLALRRILLNLCTERLPAGPGGAERTVTAISENWLNSARLAREANLLQAAFSAILQAGQANALSLSIERARLQWAQGERHEALIQLQAELQGVGGEERGRLEYAEAMLLVGDWMSETALVQSDAVIQQYKTVIDLQPNWAHGYFSLARYYDRLLEFDSAKRAAREATTLPHVIDNYGRSLKCGNTFVVRALPRLLTLWLDYGERFSDKNPSGARIETLTAINSHVSGLCDALPPYQFYTVISQLSSRIIHSNPSVYLVIERILSRLLEAFPQQAVWLLMAVFRSENGVRRKRCGELFNKAKRQSGEVRIALQNITRLTDALLELCNKNVEKSIVEVTMASICKELPSMAPLSVIIPVTPALIASITNSSTPQNVFPADLPTIHAFGEKVELLQSLVRPKKISMLGSDGRAYVFLCKPKDDLRRDYRMMELNGLINKLFSRDPACSQHRLAIRTYAVVPLNEECGLLEWVPNTHGFRQVMNDLYRAHGLHLRNADLQALWRPERHPRLTKRQIFEQNLLPKFPPLFHLWFAQTFPDPALWLDARRAFSHSCAVMCIVGYIVGLGDRHGENILLDSTTGGCVHVDFNCLFNKGEKFETPERVPFRLTNNLVDGLGVTGWQGLFRQTCELTMGMLRREVDSLMPVLTTFVYDPLIEGGSDARKATRGVADQQLAARVVQDVENRLRGVNRGIPLSVEGQVHQLILDATNPDNLCEMYIGWAPFL